MASLPKTVARRREDFESTLNVIREPT